MNVYDLSRLIDKELAAQTDIQSGCTYVPMDECGVAVANTNIVVTQLAYRIMEAYADD